MHTLRPAWRDGATSALMWVALGIGWLVLFELLGERFGTDSAWRPLLLALGLAGCGITGAVGLAGLRRRSPAGALAHAGGWYHSLVSRNPDGVYVVDPGGILRDLNGSLAAMLGYSREELIGTSYVTHVSPATLPMASAALQRMLRGEPQSFDLELCTRDGRLVAADLTGTPVLSRGRVMAVTGIVRDLSARREAQLMLRETEQRYRTLFETSMEGILVTRPDGTIDAANPAACRMLGYSEGELKALEWDAVVDANDPRTAAAVAERAHTGRFRGELTCVRADGTAFPVEMSSVEFPDHAGGVRSAVIFTDISERRRTEQLLEQREQVYRSLFDYNVDAVYLLALDGSFITINGNGARMLGYTREELEGCSYVPLIVPEEREQAAEFFRMLTQGKAEELEITVQRSDGVRLIVNVSGGPVVVGGRITGVSAVARDITERKRVEAELELAARALDNTGDGIVIVDAGLRAVSVNQAYTDITGFDATDTLGRIPPCFDSGVHGRAFYRSIIARVKQAGQWQGEVWHRRRDGTLYPALATVSGVRDQAGGVTHYVTVFNDISRQKENEQRLEFLAHHDPLTGLPNRFRLQELGAELLHRELPAGSAVAVMVIDLDQFKTLNDSLGHPMGDELLRQVADRLADLAGPDRILARLGGDEFAILGECPEHEDSPEAFPELALEALGRPFREQGGQQLFTSASIGVSCAPRDGEDMDTLLKNADAAMHLAKERGRNCWLAYSPDMDRRVFESLDLGIKLRQAIERQEFHLQYQPVVNLVSGAITGVEALIRWKHPQAGEIEPARFIPVAEATGIIGAIGEWVLHSACADAASWAQSEHGPLRVAVNLSPRQFRRGDLPERIAAVLAETGLDPRLLEVEITEGTLMENASRARDALHRLHEHGVSVAVDDFGTGYSSLGYIKMFPVDRLKLDRTFVEGLPHDAGDRTITDTVIVMARNLGIRIVAEGIETAEQAGYLRDRCCDEGQGFYFCEPLEARALAAFLAGWKPRLSRGQQETGGHPAG
ncbi:MAG TPA: PAS domain S-box protein [Gammaproteobacteria bacterium]|nr:PAS domain S-box protein [Gammaproteobacteria bacterium]